MKKITMFCLFLFVATTSRAQSKKQGGYFSLRGGPSFKDNAVKGIASISVGFSDNNTFGIGGGIGYINFEKPYIPLTVDISFFGKPGKVSPVIIGQAGYGVYNYTTTYTVGRGGFTGSLSVGVGLPMKGKNKIIVTGGYYTYGFTTTTNVYTGSNSKKTSSKENRFAATIGFKI
jgi:hypothetical protein